MIEIINWETTKTCNVCNETYVRISNPETIDIEQFMTEEPCTSCGHKQLHWN